MNKVLFIIFTLAFSANNHPIILIHGFLGWGRDEMSNYYYWGGKEDYEQKLKNLGYEVYTVSVGPISASWERAIEAYYQIKGGAIDYGYVRSDTLGIIQKPNKYFDGFYPQWDENNPIHIIGHSQGGQTARMLEMILKKSFNNEKSDLLSNQYVGWIKSITTISTPHNGSTLVPIMLDTFPFSLKLAPWFGSIDNSLINNLYDFDLDHWNLNKNINESFIDYFERLSTSPLASSKSLCAWELSLKGAAEFNKFYIEDNETYYFTFTTSVTSLSKTDPHNHKPIKKMSLHLRPTSVMMGHYNNAPDTTWRENDGIVNSISMSHPFDVTHIKFNGTPIKGTWQSMEKLIWDHQAIVGHSIKKTPNDKVFVLYKKHCELLYTLK